MNLCLAVEHDIENWNNSKSASETNPGIVAMAIKDLFRIVADETSQVGSPFKYFLSDPCGDELCGALGDSAMPQSTQRSTLI